MYQTNNYSSVLLYAVSLLFPPLLTQYLFSACAIQPHLHVIRSYITKITHFFVTGTGYGKVKKRGQFVDS